MRAELLRRGSGTPHEPSPRKPDYDAARDRLGDLLARLADDRSREAEARSERAALANKTAEESMRRATWVIVLFSAVSAIATVVQALVAIYSKK
jgi:hypothetical protein